MQAQLVAGEVARKLAVAEALGAVSKERDGLANELESAHAQCWLFDGGEHYRQRGHEHRLQLLQV